MGCNMEVRPEGRESEMYAGDDDLCDGAVGRRNIAGGSGLLPAD